MTPEQAWAGETLPVDDPKWAFVTAYQRVEQICEVLGRAQVELRELGVALICDQDNAANTQICHRPALPAAVVPSSGVSRSRVHTRSQLAPANLPVHPPVADASGDGGDGNSEDPLADEMSRSVSGAALPLRSDSVTTGMMTVQSGYTTALGNLHVLLGYV
jgi:hypothetical protein